MNISTVLGFIVAGLVMYFGVIASSPDPMIFINGHAIILVVGGTLTAALISFPIGKLFNIAKLFFKVVIFGKKVKNTEVARNIVEAANVAKSNPNALGSFKAVHPFLAEGFQLVADGILNEADLDEVLQQRSEFFKGTYSNDAKIFQSLSKYPPAFGLLGAVSGMVAMMLQLGSSKPEQIGAAMGIALIATFWGIAVANIILLPLGEFYGKLATEDYFQRRLICEGMILLKRKENAFVVLEKLNSFLPVEERMPTGDTAASGARKAA